MADTRLTKISLYRKAYLCILAILLPEKFIKEEEADNIVRNNFPKPPPSKEHSIFVIRRAFWHSLFWISIFGFIGYVAGFLCNMFIGYVNIIIIRILQIFGALFLLWGTLFVRGWEIQTLSGVLLYERVNRWLYRFLYCVGTSVIIFSLALSPFPK